MPQLPEDTYEDYIARFEGEFGEVNEAEWWYWSYGKQMPYTAVRLTAEQFAEHRAAFVEAMKHFDKAEAAKDFESMGAALAESFPHELALIY